MEKLNISHGKVSHLKRLSDANGIISALAFDQRGALKRLMAQYQEGDNEEIGRASCRERV